MVFSLVRSVSQSVSWLAGHKHADHKSVAIGDHWHCAKSPLRRRRRRRPGCCCFGFTGWPASFVALDLGNFALQSHFALRPSGWLLTIMGTAAGRAAVVAVSPRAGQLFRYACFWQAIVSPTETDDGQAERGDKCCRFAN